MWKNLKDNEPPRVYLKLHPDDLWILYKEIEKQLTMWKSTKGEHVMCSMEIDLPTGQRISVICSKEWEGKSLVQIGSAIEDL
jgi:hypothetical protein